MTLEELLGFGLAARTIAEELGRAYLHVQQMQAALAEAVKAKAALEAQVAQAKDASAGEGTP